MNCGDADSVVVGSKDQTHECFLMASVLIVVDRSVAIAPLAPGLHSQDPLLHHSML